MNLLIIRHAIAAEREDFAATGAPDSERPLTPFGRRRMKSNARGLRRAAPEIQALATSPFLRAAETARIVAAEYKLSAVQELPTLTPERAPRELSIWLRQQEPDATVAIVGHEPHLGLVATWFLSGGEASRIALKKGGACLLEFDGKVAAGGARLHWLLTPAHLRALGG